MAPQLTLKKKPFVKATVIFFLGLSIVLFALENWVAFWDYYFPKKLIVAFISALLWGFMTYYWARHKQRKEAKKLLACAETRE